MIDIQATREAYDNDVISELGWIRWEHNLADALTKTQINEAMRRFMETDKVHYEAEQFVIRNPTIVHDYN